MTWMTAELYLASCHHIKTFTSVNETFLLTKNNFMKHSFYLHDQSL